MEYFSSCSIAVIFSLAFHNGEPKNGLSSFSSFSTSINPPSISAKDLKLELMESPLLFYDFYKVTCPRAEEIIRSTVGDLYKVRPSVAPALLRLVFHDCFINGCDESEHVENGMESEKDDVVDNIKSKLEEECTGTVSCSDILVLAAREGVVLGGGPSYPLQSGKERQ